MGALVFVVGTGAAITSFHLRHWGFTCLNGTLGLIGGAVAHRNFWLLRTDRTDQSEHLFYHLLHNLDLHTEPNWQEIQRSYPRIGSLGLLVQSDFKKLHREWQRRRTQIRTDANQLNYSSFRDKHGTEGLVLLEPEACERLKAKWEQEHKGKQFQELSPREANLFSANQENWSGAEIREDAQKGYLFFFNKHRRCDFALLKNLGKEISVQFMREARQEIQQRGFQELAADGAKLLAREDVTQWLTDYLAKSPEPKTVLAAIEKGYISKHVAKQAVERLDLKTLFKHPKLMENGLVDPNAPAIERKVIHFCSQSTGYKPLMKKYQAHASQRIQDAVKEPLEAIAALDQLTSCDAWEKTGLIHSQELALRQALAKISKDIDREEKERLASQEDGKL